MLKGNRYFFNTAIFSCLHRSFFLLDLIFFLDGRVSFHFRLLAPSLLHYQLPFLWPERAEEIRGPTVDSCTVVT